jgi:uncharacterized protein (UPF0212 family)
MKKYRVVFDEAFIVEAENEHEALEVAIEQFDFGAIHPYVENVEEDKE